MRLHQQHLRVRIAATLAAIVTSSVSAFGQGGQSSLAVSLQSAAARTAAQAPAESLRRLSIDEAVRLALEQNLARSIDAMKELGFTTIGLDDEAEHLLEEEPFEGRVALVLGAEGKGLRELTRTSCDRLCRINTAGPIASLNVSNAAAVALHQAAWRRRKR